MLIVGVVGMVAGFGVFSAFSATTTNAGNEFASGSVRIEDNATVGAKLFSNTSGLAPGAFEEHCLRVTYTGSLTASAVKLFSSTATNGADFQLKVERGTGVAWNCSDFAPTSTVHDGDLGAFPSSFAGGYDGKSGAATWATNDAVTYRFRITVKDDNTANAHTTVKSTGPVAFTWEAHS